MFGELPKLFERHFAIGYLLPSVIFLIANGLIFRNFTFWKNMSNYLTGNTLVDTTLAIVLAWIFGIFLLVLNRDLYRMLEGYGKWNPVNFLYFLQEKYLNKKRTQLAELDKKYSQEGDSQELTKQRQKLMHELAQKYPPAGYSILPTSFGNAIKSFEVYPVTMYGIEGIDGWSRLQSVIPSEYRTLTDDAKAHVDWWVNLSICSFLLLLEFYIFCFSEWGLNPGWFYVFLNITIPLVIFVTLNMFFQWRATSAVISWGDYIKSGFDLYRFKLLELIGIEIPINREQEKELWVKLSQSFVYHRPDLLPPLKKKTQSRRTQQEEPDGQKTAQ